MKRKNTGFTLVEILIVVIILGILAAIVIPQFTQASDDARASALQSDLQTIRSQIELYKVQHLEAYPATTTSAVFQTALLSRTNNAGTVGTDAVLFPYGPYLQSFPKNAFAPNAVQDLVTFETDAATACPGDNSSGWWFNTATGKFCANDNKSSGGTAHNAL